LAGTWAKLKGYCARLALIVQLLRWACGEAAETEVDDVSMRGGVTLTHYFASHAERVRAAMGSRSEASGAGDHVEGQLLESLLGVVLSGGGRWDGTATDLFNMLAQYVDSVAVIDPRWPRSADSLGRLLRQKADAWRERLIISLGKAADRNRTRMISLQQVSEVSKCPNGAQQETHGQPPGGTQLSKVSEGVSTSQPGDSQDVPTSCGHLDTSDTAGRAPQVPGTGTGADSGIPKEDDPAASIEWEEGEL
jgi:hypothetical protein